MKKYTFLVFFLLIGTIGHSQINDLLGPQWQLSNIQFEGENFFTPQNTFPDIDFYEVNGLLFANGAGIDNGFEGQIEIDESNQTISFIDFVVTLLVCNSPHCWYEDLYFYDIISTNFETKTFTYDIVYLGDQANLTLTDIDGNTANYWDASMSTQEFNNSNISVSPNPASRYLNIHYQSEQLEKISIYSISGQLISEQKFESTIDISGLGAGIYFIEITSSLGKSVQKFVKK